MLRDRVLLSFEGHDAHPINGGWALADSQSAGGDRLIAQGKQTVQITFGDATQNLFIAGVTGSGKTTGAVRPALYQLIEAGCSGVILTAKEEDVGIAALYPERAVVVGASQHARPMNLIGGVNVEILRALLTQQIRQNRMADSYWGSRGVEYAVFVHRSFQLMGEEATLADLYDALSNPKWFVQRFDPWIAEQRTLPSDYVKLLNGVLADAFNILLMGESAHTTDSSGRVFGEAPKQYAWHVNMILPALRPFASDSRLRERLCAKGAASLDFEALLYRQRKVVVVDVPERLFGLTAQFVNELLRLRMRDAVLGYGRHAQEGYGTERFTFMVIDEYQQHVHFAEAGLGAGTADDNLWLDRSRSFGHINLFATQGVSSIAAQVPRGCHEAVLESLMQNFGTSVVFATHDPRTLEHVATQSGYYSGEATKHTCANRLHRGQAVVVAHNLRWHDGPLAAMVSTGAIPGFPHMARGVREAIPAPEPERFDVIRVEEDVNPLLGNLVTSVDVWNDWFERNQSKVIAGVYERLCEQTPYPSPVSAIVADDSRRRSTELHVGSEEPEDFEVTFRRADGQGWWLRIPLEVIASMVNSLEMDGVPAPFVDDAHTKESHDTPWSVTGRTGALGERGGVLLSYNQHFYFCLDPQDWVWLVTVTEQWSKLAETLKGLQKTRTLGVSGQ